MTLLPLAFWSPGPGEMLVIGIFALLLYGGDLPRMARSWGKTLQEFRRGLSGIQDEINEVIYAESDPSPPKLQYHPQFHNDDAAGDSAPVIDVDAEVNSANSDDGQIDADPSTDELNDALQDRAVAESALAKAETLRPPDATSAPPD